MRDTFHEYLNLSDREEKRDLIALCGRLQGEYEITIEPRRDARTLQQNKYYHSCFVKPLYDFLKARQWIGTQDDVHMLIRAKCLPQAIADPITGEFLATIPGSTRKLSVVRFTEFLELAREWEYDTFGIIVAEADLAREVA